VGIDRERDRNRPRAKWIAPGVIFLAATALFANTLCNGFALDDHKIIEDNVELRFLHNLPELLTRDYWEPATRGGLYRPAATLSYVLNFVVGGGDPTGFHAVNVLLHAVATSLVFGALTRLTGDGRVAVGAALLFAAHAVHTEVVASVAGGRPDLLAAVFLLLAWWLHLAKVEPRRARRTSLSWYAASLACYGIATLSKESALPFPAAIVLGDLLFRTPGSAPLRERIRELLARNLVLYLGFAAVAGASLLARALALGSLVPEAELGDPLTNPLSELPPAWRVVNALWVGVLYLRLLVAPLRLSYDYSHAQIPLIDSPSDPRLLVALGVAALLVLTLARTLRRAPAVCFAVGFFALTFALVSNVLVPIGTILGERLLYVPSIGFCLLVALAAHALARRVGEARRPVVFAVVMSLVIAPHAVRSIVRNRDWKDSSTLFIRDLESAPYSAKVQANAGWVFLLGGEAERALAHFERAIALGERPEWFLDPYRGRTYALWELRRADEARRAYGVFVRHGGADARLDQVMGSSSGAPTPRHRRAPVR
jgi:hypothetical protein